MVPLADFLHRCVSWTIKRGPSDSGLGVTLYGLLCSGLIGSTRGESCFLPRLGQDDGKKQPGGLPASWGLERFSLLRLGTQAWPPGRKVFSETSALMGKRKELQSSSFPRQGDFHPANLSDLAQWLALAEGTPR